ncbi:hypothetical protein CFP56_002695 [Quercus suber]|uniref:Uncharacterized protein n=1 Tax=Quercus suber TaxID=58331 RepID=A0AAW0LF37_QUESU
MDRLYPLFAAVGVAVGICGMQLVRNICANLEVRFTKEHRTAGVLDNFEEGSSYTIDPRRSCHPSTSSSRIQRFQTESNVVYEIIITH